MEDFRVGSVVLGEVTGIESYGIFVKLNNGYSGLVHISEITEKFVKDVNNYAKIGEEIYVEIKNIDSENKKCILSVKGLNYRIDDNKLVKESVRGFTPLKQHLPLWIEDKYKEIHKQEE
ncbi:MAG: S1 RNA-binding domain-containing protein [Bacilli bacterium]|nr:S1 RNA-binding domain-containing protein [Bacilli bacterium]